MKDCKECEYIRYVQIDKSKIYAECFKFQRVLVFNFNNCVDLSPPTWCDKDREGKYDRCPVCNVLITYENASNSEIEKDGIFRWYCKKCDRELDER